MRSITAMHKQLGTPKLHVSTVPGVPIWNLGQIWLK